MEESVRKATWPDLAAYGSHLRMVQTQEGRRALVICATEDRDAWRAQIEARVGLDAWAFDQRLGGFLALAPLRIAELRAWFPKLTFSAPSQATVIDRVKPSAIGPRSIAGHQAKGCIRYPNGIEVRDARQLEDGKYACGVALPGDRSMVFTGPTAEDARQQAEAWAVRVAVSALSHDSAVVRVAEDGVRAELKRYTPNMLLDKSLRSTAVAAMRAICAHGRVLRDVGGRSNRELDVLTEGVWKAAAIGNGYVTTPGDLALVERLSATYDRPMGRYLFPAHMRAEVEAEFAGKYVALTSEAESIEDIDPARLAVWRAAWEKEIKAVEGALDPEQSRHAVKQLAWALAEMLPSVRQGMKEVVAAVEKTREALCDRSVEAAIGVLVDRAEAATTRTEGYAASLEATALAADEQLDAFSAASYVEGGRLRVDSIERALLDATQHKFPRRDELERELGKPRGEVAACQSLRLLLGNLWPPTAATAREAAWAVWEGPQVPAASHGVPGLLVRMDRALERWREQIAMAMDSVSSLREGAYALIEKCRRFDQLSGLRRIGAEELDALSVRPGVKGADGMAKPWSSLRFEHGSGYTDGVAMDFVGPPHVKVAMCDPDPALTVAYVQRLIDRSSSPRAPGRPIAMWEDPNGQGTIVGMEVAWRIGHEDTAHTAIVPIKASYMRYFQSKHAEADVRFEVPTPVQRATGVMVVAEGRPLGLVSAVTTAPPFNSSAQFEAQMAERDELARDLGLPAEGPVMEAARAA